MPKLNIGLNVVEITIPDFDITFAEDPSRPPPPIRYRAGTGTRQKARLLRTYVTHTFSPELRQAKASCTIDLDRLFGDQSSWDNVGTVLMSQFAADIVDAYESESTRYYVWRRATLASLTFTIDSSANRLTGAVLDYWLFVGRQRDP